MSKSTDISVTPTITAGAYSAGDALGGLLTFTSAASVYKGDGKITKVVISDNAKQAAHLALALFDRTFTAMVDNAAWDPSDADNLNCLGVIDIPIANYGPGVDNNVAYVECDFNFALVAGGTSLFGQLYIITSTPTYAAVNDIQVTITVNR